MQCCLVHQSAGAFFIMRTAVASLLQLSCLRSYLEIVLQALGLWSTRLLTRHTGTAPRPLLLASTTGGATGQ